MTQPLNYTPKAMEDLAAIPWQNMPGCAAATRYLLDKLNQAQVFVLGDHGELLDRSSPKPEVPGLILRPPFNVVALEYTSASPGRRHDFYTAATSSRRISLVWDWRNDMPPGFGSLHELPAGVMVASIAWIDERQAWLPMMGAMHFAYDDEWADRRPTTPFAAAMLATGGISPRVVAAKSYPATAVPLFFEACLQAQEKVGTVAAVIDAIHADTADEVNAYWDLCFALACKNVTTREHRAPANLNRHRLQKGKLPLKGFHVLELASGGEMPTGGRSGDRAAARSHLRRGHIRRLSGDRVTWVNSTIVRGRGFIEKVYAA